MEQTQARVLTVLAAVLLLATALLYGMRPEPDRDPEASRLVWRVDADAIQWIEVQRAEGPLKLRRQGEGWRLEAPIEAEAEPFAVQRLLEALESVRWGALLVDPAEPEEYGLGEPPVARVIVGLRDGSEQQLVLGDAAPVGAQTYARDAQGEIVVIEGRPGREATEDASRFRDHRIFDFAPQDVRRVTLQGPEGLLSVHGQGSRWWLDGFTRADPDRVDDLVVGLLDLRFDLFLDAVSMAGPERVVTVELQDGATDKLFVGPAEPRGRIVWTGRGQGGIVHPDSLRLLGQGPTDLGDPRAFPIDLERVDSVAVTLGEQRIQAVSDGPAWRVQGKIAPDAQIAVEALAQAAIHYRRDPVPPIEARWAMVEIRSGAGIAVIDLGQVVEGSFRVAQDRAGGEPYLVPLDDLEPILALIRAEPDG